MKVLQINSVCGIGSTGRIATDIHNLLIEQGHESYIAYGRNVPIKCDNPLKIGSQIDNYMHVALTRIFDNHGFGSKKATEEFVREIIALDPDVIHLHNIHGYYINIEVLFNYLKQANKPVIWTLHDCWAFTGHCSYFDYVCCDKWKSECYSCPQKSAYPASMFIDNSKKNFLKKKNIFSGVKNLTIVTPSIWLAELVNKSFLNEYKVRVINNGIDLNIFKPTESEFRQKYKINDKYVILGVASIWDKRKGLEYFFELSSLLKTDEVIVLVGLSEAQKKKMPENIIGITKTNNVHELAEIYTVADVFVNPTLEDNFPTTNLEALACGTPVITFNTGGSIECIDDYTGIIVDKGSLIQLKSGMHNLKKTKGEAYKEKCVERAKLLFDKNERYLDYLKIYNKSN